MPISIEKNCVFIAIPKTGSASIDYWLKKHGKLLFFTLSGTDRPFIIKNTAHQHLLPKDLWDILHHQSTLKIVPELTNFDYTKARWFCVVRHPYTKFASMVRYVSGSSWIKNPSQLDILKQARSTLAKQKSDLYLYNNMVRPQADFVQQLKDLPVASYVIKYEEMLELEQNPDQNLSDTQLEAIRDLIPPPEKVNVRNPGLTDEYILTPAVKELLNEFYARDFELLGYEKF